jgi:hypothetical protein
MNEPDVFRQLQQEDLFELFRQQLGKDFSSSGADAAFVEHLSRDYETVRTAISKAVSPMTGGSGAQLGSLLYRIDISEKQLSGYLSEHEGLSFADAVAELIIKRVLQKVILRKKFR